MFPVRSQKLKKCKISSQIPVGSHVPEILREHSKSLGNPLEFQSILNGKSEKNLFLMFSARSRNSLVISKNTKFAVKLQ